MKKLPLLLASMILFACSSIADSVKITEHGATNHHTNLAAKDLVGKIERKDLINWSEHQQDDYVPDVDTISELRNVANEYTIKIFMGTWCHDSKREVPRLFNILDAIGFDDTQLELIALNYSKQTPSKLEAGHNILKTPTFVVFKDGKEVGRIIETPKESLEKDLLKITTQ